jgi:hypothetical protein
MRHLLRLAVLGFFVLSFAVVTPAQRFIAHPSSPTVGSTRIEHHRDDAYSYNTYPYAGFGYRTHRAHSYSGGVEAPDGIGYAHGDPTNILSAYMDYDRALALGKQMLQEKTPPSTVLSEPSLGEVARRLRQSSSSPNSSESKVSATQNAKGEMVICRDVLCG